ncbi:hypothetical protein FEM08_17000 [Flavobacterium gilvum]|nr:hypothetical protein FEM08_17000 [Flavobacterium gilvum]
MIFYVYVNFILLVYYFRNCAIVDKLTFFLIKTPALTGWRLKYYFMRMYYFAGAGVAGVAGAFCAGAVAGAAVSDFSMIFDSESLKVPVKLKPESKIKAINIVANVQVLLSKKSVVFCTPPNI